ncbi:exopolysaccharide production repressor protein [Rhizobium sp. 007]|uniref:exopolysaccharide production repressor protein n=1 Tax=Rhizobium sp. 007 TaxID=2785056 RepID=UPI00188F9185|nr:exopolysaccharide production repressor protein [Rhizobium sp. 007]QPB18670.1 exopolysaccharide production repressor protein [Rhizobium sp. 007]
MYAPRVFVSMIGALAVFAVATYWLNGSLATTLIDTVICAVLLQLGYFGGVLFLVWKEAKARNTQGTTAVSHTPARSDDKEKIPVSPFNGSEPFNR